MESKLKILNAALSLFSERGYEAVGVQEIVETAGFSKPTLYHHFGSKLGLYQEIINHFGQKYISQISKLSVYSGDLTKNLNEISISLISEFYKDKEFFYFWNIASVSRSQSAHFDFAQTFTKSLLAPIEELFSSALKDIGGLKAKESLLTYHFIGTIKTTLELLHLNIIPYSSDLPYRVVHQFLHGVLA